MPGLSGLLGPKATGPALTPTVDVSQLPPTNPQVVAEQPQPGEELPLDGSIDVYFDQPMNQATVEAALSFAPAIQTDVTWVSDSTLRVTPKAGQLARASRYSLTIAASAQASNGLTLENPVELKLQTVGYLLASQVVPADQADGVATDSVITVLFNRPVVPLTIAENQPGLPQPLSFSPDVPGTGEWINTSIYQWTPSQPMAGGSTYTVTVAGTLTDQTGGVMEQPYSWSFTTLPPQVVSVNPSASGVRRDVTVEVQFNQPMDHQSAQAAFSLDAYGQLVTGSFTWSDDDLTMTFKPSGLLDYSYNYVATEAGSAQSASGGLTLGQDTVWSFDVAAAPGVLTTSPLGGETSADTWSGLRIVFTAPMDEKTLTEDLLDVSPALPKDVTFYYNSYDYSWNANFQLEPSTDYTVTLKPGAADPYGTRIDQPYTWTFTTAPLDPAVQLNTQGSFGLYDASKTTQLFVLHRNVSTISFQLAKLTLADFARLTGPNSYDALQNFTPSADQLVRSWTVDAQSALNEAVYVRVPVVSDTGGMLPPGYYLLIADAPELQSDIRHFMLVTNANLTYKSSFNQSMVWLTDLDSGQPIGGAPVTFYDQNLNVTGSGSTAADGTLTAPTSYVDNLWDLRYAVVDDGTHFAVGLNYWDDGVQPWQFGNIPTQYNNETFTLYTYTDRPIYRPGQDVYFKGVLRAKDDVTYSLPSQTAVHIKVYDDQGNVVFEQDEPVDDMGTFTGSITLDTEAGLGYYSIEAAVGQLTTYQGFQVAEYQKPEFIVTVTPNADQVLAGKDIKVTVDAEYFFGGPVTNADVTWTVLSDQYFFTYTGRGNYSFYDYNQDQRDTSANYIPGFGQQIAQGSGKTDANGKLLITIPSSLEAQSGSQVFTIEATVSEIAGTQVSGRTQVTVHRGQVYVGVSPDVYVGNAGDPITASLIAVGWDSQPVANQQVTVEFIDQVWKSVQEEDQYGRTQWTWTIEETPAADPVTVTTDAQGKASVSFTPPSGGTFKIRATVANSAGNKQSASAFVWVSGSEFVAWRQANNDRIDLVPDKNTYAPGETAEILIASPYQGQVQALVTIERGSVLSHEVITLTSNSYVYKLPITGDLAPNVYVSVVIVKGVDDTNPTPGFKMGLVKIGVDPVQQTLNLTVTPNSEQVAPGTAVTYTVKATDYQGKPVDAEVSLALVDLATLQLAPPNSGAIVDHFYGNAGLAVRTSIPMINLVDRLTQDLIDQGKGGGGGGGEGFFDIRTQFKDTAYWSADVRTGASGQTTVSVTLPDNLTTWRMDARAVTANTLVGQQTVDVVATKPLLIRPQTPRFFVVNDEATLSALVNNNTDAAISADVALEGTGLTIVGDAKQTVNIPANDSVQVDWPVTVDANAQWVDLTFSAQGGGLSDASKPTLGDPNHNQQLPVYNYEVPETVGTAGQLTAAGDRTEGVVLPPNYNVTQGSVDVQIDPSLAAATVEGLTYLEHYPYECTEQTVSRFLPNALTLRAIQQLGLDDTDLRQKLDGQLAVGIQRLYAQQHVDGGWGWWVNSPSNATVSAYVVQGLLAAQDAGWSVDQRVLTDGINYLKGQLQSLDVISAQYALHTQTYVLYVLAEAGQPDVSRTVQMYGNRQNMQAWAEALLAQTLWMIDPNDARLANIQSDLNNAAIVSATGSHWEEDSPDTWNWNTDTRSTAIILDTFAKIWPTSDLAPNIVRWLMVARRGGHWETTQETAWALIGLTDYMVTTGELKPDFTWTFSFNGQQRANGVANASTVQQSQTITIDVGEMVKDAVNRLTFSRTDGAGRLYYTTHLTAYLPVDQVQPLSRGVIVSRRYLDASGNPVTEGKVGDVLTVQLSIVAPNDLYYVVVTDPYPAGADAVNPTLLTELVLGQRPELKATDPLAQGWGWWWFSQTDLRDEKAVLFADYLPAGTYEYTYQIRLGSVGKYRVIPPVAQEFYFPEVYGRGAGSLFTVLPK